MAYTYTWSKKTLGLVAHSGMVLMLVALTACGGGEKAKPKAKAEPPAPKAPVAPVPLAEYFQIRRIAVRGAAFTHDEKMVAYVSDQGGRPDLWLSPLAGGEPRQVTHVEGFLLDYALSPKSDHLVYAADQGGTELAHLYLTNSAGEAPVDLNAADPPTTRATFVRWSDDGKAFLYLCNRRDEKALDLYEYAVKGGKTEMVWQASEKLTFAAVSRDHKKVVVMEVLSDVNSNLYMVQRGKKKAEPKLLTPHEGDVLFEATDISPDGKSLYYTSDAAREFTALFALDLKSNKATPVLEAEWDVENGAFSRTGKYFYTVTNVDGTPQVAVQLAKDHTPVSLPSVGESASIMGVQFSPSDRYLAANLVSDARPTTPVVIDLQESTVTTLADPLPASLKERPMVAGTSIKVTSFDEKPVQAFLYAPPGEGPFPAVIDVHGGPTAQSRRVFDPMRQYLVSKGYVVLVPNVRGSTGYGKSFTKLDNMDLGGGPLKDVIACKQWLGANAKVDLERVAIMGGSYGGYMTLAAATFAPKEFAAHVDYFGVSDLKTLMESFPPYWAAFSTYLYAKFGDPKNPEHAAYQHDRSPLNFADQIERPLLVVQGENDARVKKDQSDRIVAKLRERKVPVHYLVLAGEGHGFSKNENRLLAYQTADAFLDRYLFGDTSITLPAEAAPAEAAPAEAAPAEAAPAEAAPAEAAPPTEPTPAPSTKGP